MTSVSHEETTVPRSDVPLTRASFIADDHVKTAITHLETIWRIDDAGCVEVPMPPSVKETGVLPIGYCVDFLYEPLLMVEKLAKDNIKYESQLKKETYREFKDIINGPSNLAIIPTVTRDEKLRILAENLEKDSKDAKDSNKENL